MIVNIRGFLLKGFRDSLIWSLWEYGELFAGGFTCRYCCLSF